MDSQGSLGIETDVISGLREQVKALEAKVFSVEEGHGPTRRASGIRFDRRMTETTAQTEVTDESDEHVWHPIQLTNSNTIPEVRKCNYMEFKNRFGEDDSRYAVDVLISGPLLNEEYEEEKSFREKYFETGKITSRKEKSRAGASTRAMNRSNNQALLNAQSRDTWIRRIRIQSPALLKIMSMIQGESWSSRPRTYHRPFSSLVYFHPQIKDKLAELESRWGSFPATALGGQQDPKDESDYTVDSCPMALAVMRCYVQFIDNEIMPDMTQFDTLDYTSNAQIWFFDLWYLFRTGELVHRPLEGDMLAGQKQLRTGKRTWRTYGVKPRDASFLHTHTDHRKYDTQEPTDDSTNFVVRAYYIEYTGDEFCAIPKSFAIPQFQGPRSITSLPVYPVRFATDWQKALDNATAIGEKVLQYLEAKQGSYNAWTITRSPAGDVCTDDNGMPLKHAEHINSEVLVDFSEAFETCPAWKPKREILQPETVNQVTDSDYFPILWWSGSDRAKLLGESSELIIVRTGVSGWEQNKCISEGDKLLVKMSKNDSNGVSTTRQDLRREDMCLITGRVFAYIFQERKFAQIDVRKMGETAGSRDALNSLRIHPKTKKTIEKSVRGHLLQRASERHTGEQQSLDPILGKGGGLFILLHGVPGVGKTATAEAIAQANCKPLFKITCGDLGLTPEQVESSLRGIFRLAGVWDCILLLDEVDTFFSQRSKGDSALHKNALVSVFLRILDYYTGILFLTTNRAGSLDEAFKSRIHFKIYYPPLSKNQTLEIWEINIQRLRRIEEEQRRKGMNPATLEISKDDILTFASKQFETNQLENRPQWNGRQIRNAFQVARSLAYTDAMAITGQSDPRTSPEPHDPRVLRLEVSHFELVAEITESFNEYMLSVYGGMTDGDLAGEAEHRNDKHDDAWNARPYDEHHHNHRDSFSGVYSQEQSHLVVGPSARPRASSFSSQNTNRWPGEPTLVGLGMPPQSQPQRQSLITVNDDAALPRTNGSGQGLVWTLGPPQSQSRARSPGIFPAQQRQFSHSQQYASASIAAGSLTAPFNAMSPRDPVDYHQPGPGVMTGARIRHDTSGGPDPRSSPILYRQDRLETEKIVYDDIKNEYGKRERLGDHERDSMTPGRSRGG